MTLSLLGLVLALAPLPAAAVAIQETGVSTAAPARPAAPAGPRIHLSADKLDFGKVASGASVSGEITLESVGDAALRITRVGVTCECAQIRLSTATELNVPIAKSDEGKTDLTLEPGTKATLKLTIDTTKLAAGHELKKRCMIFCSDAAKSPLSIPFSLTIEAPPVPAQAPAADAHAGHDHAGQGADEHAAETATDAAADRNAARKSARPPPRELRPPLREPGTAADGTDGTDTDEEGDDHRPAPTPIVPTGPPPRIECDTYKAGFGEVYRGEKLHHTFTIKNTGQGGLVLQEVRNTCSCQVSKLRIQGRTIEAADIKNAKLLGTLQPGEEAYLDVELKTATATVPGRDVQLSKAIKVFHSDATRNPLTLTLEARMITPFTVVPEKLNFGKVRRGAGATISATLTSDRLGAFRILKVASPNDEIVRFDIKQIAGEGDDTVVPVYQIDATLLPGAPLGSFVNRLQLEIDHERLKEIQLPVLAVVEPNVRFTGNTKEGTERLDFGILNGEADAVIELKIDNDDAAVPYVPAISKVEAKPSKDPFHIELIEVEKGQKYTLRITLPKSIKPASMFSGWIELTADHPDVPLKKLYFRGWFRGGKQSS